MFPFAGLTEASAIDIVGNGKANNMGLFQASINAVTGAAIGTTTAPALWNPSGSGKVMRILAINLADESGTIIRAHVRHYWAQNPILSGLTAGSIQARNGVASVGYFYTALTVGAAATQWMPAVGSGGAVAAQFYNLQEQAFGWYTVNPNELFYPYVSNAALAMVASVGLIWVETPIPTGN